MKRINSTIKGKKGELEVAELLRNRGYEARRGRQYCGGADSPDVVHSIPGVHIEVKRCEKLRIRMAMIQAEVDADNGMVPVVAHRWNNGPWYAILSLEALIDLWKIKEKFAPEDAG